MLVAGRGVIYDFGSQGPQCDILETHAILIIQIKLIISLDLTNPNYYISVLVFVGKVLVHLSIEKFLP